MSQIWVLTPWLHQMNGVASTLHQCIKFMQGNELTTVYSDSVTTEGTCTNGIPVVEIKHDDDMALTGFTLETFKIQICSVGLPLFWDKIPPAMKMMKLMNFIPGLGLDKRLQGQHTVIEVKDHTTDQGLGYVPPPADIRENKRLANTKATARKRGTSYGTPEITRIRLGLAAPASGIISRWMGCLAVCFRICRVATPFLLSPKH